MNIQGQAVLSRQVIGSMSLSLNNSSKQSYSTVGEAVIPTLSSSSYSLTQGFQQPLSNLSAISFTVEYSDATCPTSFDATAEVSGISGCTDDYQIIWSSGDSGMVAMNLSPGLYSVTVSSGLCQTVQEFEITSGPAALCNIKFFNAFSPNNDGVNDTWIIQNITSPEYAQNNIEIFNRWGQLIWKADNYDNYDVVWKGKSDSGLELSDGTYYYIAEVGGVKYKGYIELTR